MTNHLHQLCPDFRRSDTMQQSCVKLSNSDCKRNQAFAPRLAAAKKLRNNCLNNVARQCMEPALCGTNKDGTPRTNCRRYKSTMDDCRRRGVFN